jgi:hypothetical protein
MGFMDKAKKLAEQAQEKLDEAQKNFNASEPGAQDAEQAPVRYDAHGRPIQEETPAAATAPPSATPAPEPAAPSSEPAAEEKPVAGGANANPDPFKPIGQ